MKNRFYYNPESAPNTPDGDIAGSIAVAVPYKITDIADGGITYTGETYQIPGTYPVAVPDQTTAIWRVRRSSLSGLRTVEEYAAAGAWNQIYSNRAALFPAVSFSNAYSTQFAGANQRAETPHVAALDFDRLNPFSLSMWIKSVGTASITLFQKRAANIGYEWTVDGSNRMLFELRQAAGNRVQVRLDTSTVRSGAWEHIAVTYSGSSTAAGVKFYLNGTERTTKTTLADTLTLAITNAGKPTIAANSGGGTEYSGNIDEVSVWNVALSAANITAIYNSNVGVTDLSTHAATANLVSWWRMGDGATFPTIPDVKSAYNMTMVNMTAGDFETETPP